MIAPDACTNFSAASETGATTNAAVVIRQRCAVELATIERTLAAAGYSVISWRQLRDRVDAPRDTERDPRSTALAAAQRFGAQALVEVNSHSDARHPVDEVARVLRQEPSPVAPASLSKRADFCPRADNGSLSTVPEELPIEGREFSAFRPSVSISRVDRPDSVETATRDRLLDEVVNDCVAQMVARLDGAR